MNDKPLVSVIVPTHKRAHRIRRALDSILAQSYDSDQIEIIVVNDNDPNSGFALETDAVLQEYVQQPRVRALHTPGSVGGGAARNLGCRAASGEYLAFLDDDDEFMPSKIESQVAFMLDNDLEMSWQDVSWYNEEGDLVEHRHLDHCTDYSRQGLLRAHLLTPIAPTSIYMLKKDLFDRTEGFGEVKTGQDWWLMLRCIEADAKIGYMPEVHVRQYLHKDGRLSTGQNKIDGEKERFEVAKQYYRFLSKKDIRYIKFRHNAVLAFACMRSGRTTEAMKYALRTLASSPADCIRQGIEYFGRAKKE